MPVAVTQVVDIPEAVDTRVAARITAVADTREVVCITAVVDIMAHTTAVWA